MLRDGKNLLAGASGSFLMIQGYITGLVNIDDRTFMSCSIDKTIRVMRY